MSTRVLSQLFNNETDDFDDGLADKVYSKGVFRNVLKEEWIAEAKKIYCEWLDAFTNITNSLNKIY